MDEIIYSLSFHHVATFQFHIYHNTIFCPMTCISETHFCNLMVDMTHDIGTGSSHTVLTHDFFEYFVSMLRRQESVDTQDSETLHYRPCMINLLWPVHQMADSVCATIGCTGHSHTRLYLTYCLLQELMIVYI